MHCCTSLSRRAAMLLAIVAAPLTAQVRDAHVDPNWDPEEGSPMIVLEPSRDDADGGIAGSGEGCETIGDFIQVFTNPNRFRGDLFKMTQERILEEFSLELSFTGSLTLYYSVYEAEDPGISTTYNKLDLTGIGGGDIVVTAVGTGQKFYSSGPIDVDPGTEGQQGLVLEAGKQYAIGVSWGGPAPSYGRDTQTYPLAFSSGTVEGAAAFTLAEGPPPAETVTIVPFQGGAYSMEVCFAPQPGACCIDDNGIPSCEDLHNLECLALEDAGEGILTDFTAPGVLCSDLPDGCPLDQFACCVGDQGSCLNRNVFACEDAGGLSLINEFCSDQPNPCLPSGACCVGSSCLDSVLEDDCQAMGGVYRGDDAICATVDPPCTSGACCTGEECFFEDTEQDCTSSGGLFAGAGTNCQNNPCILLGACCNADDTCTDDVEQGDCQGAGGVYRGDFTVCSQLDPPCGRGACCTASDGCLGNLLENTCNLINGTYQGDGTSCGGADAIECPGACCWLSGCVESITPSECADLPDGTFSGYGMSCVDTEPNYACDAGNVTGACCKPDGECVQSTFDACMDLGGGFDEGLTCPEVIDECEPVAVGACCSIGGDGTGQCSEQTQEQCNAIANSFYNGDGTECTIGLCRHDACCDLGVSCMEDFFAACVDAGLSFQDGQSCDVGDPCNLGLGACCLPDETCEFIFEPECDSAGGVFIPGELCNADTCDAGACCEGDGTCSDVLSGECTGDGAEFLTGQLCGPDTCPPLGACCIDGACSQLTQTGCLAFGGQYTSDGAPCTQDSCVPGACCFNDGGCLNVVLGATCEEASGVHSFIAEDMCENQPCPPTGACCVDGECLELVADACNDIVGATYLGDGSVCDEQSCELGACCELDGTCSDVLGGECTGACSEFLAGEVCGPDTCPVAGACCIDGTCLELPETACGDQGGIFGGDGVPCTEGSCDTGACCAGDGSCSDGIQVECSDPAADFLAGETCGLDPCPPLGACCIEGACSQLTETGCLAAGGLYSGDGAECLVDTCDPGACCASDGTCTDGVLGQCTGVDTEFLSGEICGPDTCPAPGACCLSDLTCIEVMADDCLAIGDAVYFGDGTVCVDGGCPMGIISSYPPNDAIDARQPSMLDGSNPTGWDSIDLEFGQSGLALTPDDFELSEDGGDGTPPEIIDVIESSPGVYTVTFDEHIELKAWTTITFLGTGDQVRIGYLPADVNNDGTSGVADVLALIDGLNGATVLEEYQADIDRSGLAGAADVLRVIDLLNGAGVYEEYNLVSLPN